MVLYHASQRKNLRVITPQKTLSHDKYIGDFVFATKNKKMALMYLVPKGLATLMNPKGPRPNIVICCRPEVFIKKDTGGAVYTLPSDGFRKTPQEGLMDYEMVNDQPVKPLKHVVYDSVITALTSAQISIKFIDEKTFSELIGHPDQERLIDKLANYKP